MGAKLTGLEKLARDEVAAVLAELPEPLAEAVRRVPVLFETRPGPDDGPDDDLMGLFVGTELACEGDDPLPPRIMLFLENIRDEAGCEGVTFREEVRITYLHELGHYLGLDEDGLTSRGLE